MGYESVYQGEAHTVSKSTLSVRNILKFGANGTNIKHCALSTILFFLSFFGVCCNKLLKLKKNTRKSYFKLEDLLRDVWIAGRTFRTSIYFLVKFEWLYLVQYRPNKHQTRKCS